ncbi:hypothetical protein PsorP6_009390 [Peronosclerospora sorghi]|uniref:Uncharacterized protein n=1 Tax=Peronosclerospora sorghi TaxID=230839 RepID=A0ACC0VXE9_9STRA|nr:hypothetical protein PsorP6_009390 [Peronosclerospora sorghi]
MAAYKSTPTISGVESNELEQGHYCHCATNFPYVLDNALIRPGRFDRHVTVDLPDVADRKEILEYYGSNVPLGKD